MEVPAAPGGGRPAFRAVTVPEVERDPDGMMAPKDPSYSALPRNPYGRPGSQPAAVPRPPVLISYEFL